MDYHETIDGRQFYKSTRIALRSIKESQEQIVSALCDVAKEIKALRLALSESDEPESEDT